MLRWLASYYYKEPNCLFTVRVAQGLVHMGKGRITVNLFFCDWEIMSRPAVAGLLMLLTVFTDAKGCIYLLASILGAVLTSCSQVVLNKYHWMLYYIVTVMYLCFLLGDINGLSHAHCDGLGLEVSSSVSRPASRTRSWASKCIRRLYDWVRTTVQSLRRRSSCQVRWSGALHHLEA